MFTTGWKRSTLTICAPRVLPSYYVKLHHNSRARLLRLS
jgi:hypothetical protein